MTSPGAAAVRRLAFGAAALTLVAVAAGCAAPGPADLSAVSDAVTDAVEQTGFDVRTVAVRTQSPGLPTATSLTVAVYVETGDAAPLAPAVDAALDAAWHSSPPEPDAGVTLFFFEGEPVEGSEFEWRDNTVVDLTDAGLELDLLVSGRSGRISVDAGTLAERYGPRS
ncbi:hypothetical protein CLV46_0393 [Diaminobutyricimonas aerilata]|uniref:GerMN domain-containing protein n=1 Tax=Diaminobutyricimonas aerilata TaxID=1162967 RepID=A0A2M9CG03_9MICO|nr:hypothetical protein [Diaminobutyricimonas aerilata]PJJ70864.1 hypothetical protein CLV46_0393 [Diaminobutyricimonas aerilata]